MRRPSAVVVPVVASVVLGLVVVACSAPGGCQPIAPRLLPDGSAPAAGRIERGEGRDVVTWGAAGIQRVTQEVVSLEAGGVASCAPAEVPLELGCFPTSRRTSIGARPAVFFAADAGPAAAVEMSFVEGPCLYHITVGPGLTSEQVRAYAAQF